MKQTLLTYLTVTVLSLVSIIPVKAEVENNKFTNISALLDSYQQLDRFNGAITIKQGKKVVYRYANGFANISTATTNDSNKIFAIGSLSKQFTATAILLLAQQGKLSLDDSIDKHLPYYKNEVGQRATIYHLLTHTAGIPDPMDTGKGIDGIDDPLMKEKTLPISKEALIATFKDLPNHFAPGERHEYTNTGYILLADIIERITGKAYSEYLQAAIFTPADMMNTSTFRPVNNKRLVESYNGIGTDKVHTTKIDGSWLFGAGGLYSTTLDLFKWVDAVNNNKIFKSRKLDNLLAKPIDLGRNNEFYGYGLEMEELWGEKVYRHDGATAGTIADFLYFPEQDITMVIYLNRVHNVSHIAQSINMRKNIVQQVSGILLKDNPAKVLALKSINDYLLAEFVGLYTFDDNHQIEIIRKDDELHLQTIGDKSWSLFNLAQNTHLPKEPLTQSSTRLFELLNTDKLEGLADIFDEKMAAVPLNVFEGFWQQMASELGALEDNYSYAKNESHNQIKQRLIFNKGIVDMTVFFNKDGKIEGIQNASPIAKDTNQRFTTNLITLENGQLMVDGYVLKQQDDLFLKFTRNANNKITGLSYNQQGQHVATKQ